METKDFIKNSEELRKKITEIEKTLFSVVCDFKNFDERKDVNYLKTACLGLTGIKTSLSFLNKDTCTLRDKVWDYIKNNDK